MDRSTFLYRLCRFHCRLFITPQNIQERKVHTARRCMTSYTRMRGRAKRAMEILETSSKRTPDSLRKKTSVDTDQTSLNRESKYEGSNDPILQPNNPDLYSSDQIMTETSPMVSQDFVPLALKLLTQGRREGDALRNKKSSVDVSLAELDKKLQSIKSEVERLESERNLDPDYELKQMLLGESDPSIKPSNVPCGGCGAFLHCTNPGIPGFMPAANFEGASEQDLGTMKCTRCTLMEKNKFLQLDIDEESYKKVIERIKSDQRALVLMLVDVTDIANTLIKDYIKEVVKSKPVVIVGNKIDLIPPDAGAHKHLFRVRDRILDDCYRQKIDMEAGDIKDIYLISAKTGFGVEELINKLVKKWGTKGNVYLVGTTNSGKSTLFNRFLDSDYCKSSCRDIVQRATISRWPGTTFDLLKFPLARLSTPDLSLRVERLQSQRLQDHDKKKHLKEKYERAGRSKSLVLFGTVGKTDFRTDKQREEDDKKLIVTGQQMSEYVYKEEIDVESEMDASLFSPKLRIIQTEEYPDSRWVFDTPGLINSEQLLNYMTPEELQIMLKMEMIRPRVFTIEPGHTMFVTGMARLDYLEGRDRTLATVHLQHFLPVRVVKTVDADKFYEENFNSDSWDQNFKMPVLQPSRMKNLPLLESKVFQFSLHDIYVAEVDIQLSSLGWVSFAGNTAKAEVKVYTPGGKGIHLRTPALLPNILTFKGVRIKDTQAYSLRKLRPRIIPRKKGQKAADRDNHDTAEQND